MEIEYPASNEVLQKKKNIDLVPRYYLSKKKVILKLKDKLL